MRRKCGWTARSTQIEEAIIKNLSQQYATLIRQRGSDLQGLTFWIENDTL